MFTALSRLIRAMILVCACLSCLSVAADDKITIASDRAAQQLFAEAENLIATGRSDAAYSMLKGHEATLAGDTLFDYLLGVAALDAGLHSEAIFSLQRAVAVSPDFAGARMELARAYFESNNKALARSLFVSLRNENPPPNVRSVIEDYIAAIDARPDSRQARFAPFVEFGAGYDNNANGSTDSQTFLGFTLSPNNLKTESPFTNIAAGFNVNKPRGRDRKSVV